MERSENQEFNQTTGNTESGFSSSAAGSSSISEPESGGITGKLKSVGSSVKDKAAGLPGLIADGLEAGARALKQRQPAASGADGTSVVVSSDSNIAAVTDTLATGMQSSADWIRDADIDKLKDGVEKQVKEHPARSLLIALGAGYLIGKALRR
ncbi:MAG TPA: hypothetical protein VJS39_09345 [Gemmatimonadaceae bacterium]|nr:hypothetical protein [Gemmatimonadaceae bacterium]